MPDKDIAALSFIDRRITCWKNDQVSRFGLTAAQVPIVILACFYGGISQNEVVSVLGLEKSVVAKSVGNLIAAGFLTRERNKRDKRAYDLSPTESAMTVFPELLLNGQMCMALLTSGFTDEEKTLLGDLLEKMARNADSLLR